MRAVHWLSKLGVLGLTLLMMMLFVPSLMAGTMAHGPHLVTHEVTMPEMAGCHDAEPVVDCCADLVTSDTANPCAIACLSMAGACAAPVLLSASLEWPPLNQMAMLPRATDVSFASVLGVPDTPPPKA